MHRDYNLRNIDRSGLRDLQMRMPTNAQKIVPRCYYTNY